MLYLFLVASMAVEGWGGGMEMGAVEMGMGVGSGEVGWKFVHSSLPSFIETITSGPVQSGWMSG